MQVYVATDLASLRYSNALYVQYYLAAPWRSP